MERSRQAGFSMVEMMVALTVTLMITGAIYKLLSSGQNAFRREPALADRQQNIRSAMDTVSRDVFKAGLGLPEFVQVFTQNLNEIGPLMGSGGRLADQIEFVASGDCPPMELCNVNGDQMTLKEGKPGCMVTPGKLLFAHAGEWHLVPMKQAGPEHNNACKTGGSGANGHLVVDLPGGQKLCKDTAGGPDTVFTSNNGACPTWVMSGDVIRYRIANDTSNVPNLERSRAGTDGPWEIVARGIEDLQVEYRRGNSDVWDVDPGLMPAGATDPAVLVWRVRVSLSARVVGEVNLAGQSRSVVDNPNLNAVRGRLVSEIVPRPAQTYVAQSKAEE